MNKTKTIRQILIATEFKDLIEKFENTGNFYLSDFINSYNNGRLLEYLKNFEKDDIKAIKLENIIKNELKKNSSPFFNNMFIFMAIFFVLMFILILISLKK
ncbi:MAG TPA: hypothetical protein PKN96_10895 [Flavobacterium sp.]|uniref:hypothetical protein n=1 Tax=Flavobacterium sp. TaxID=239 RepID=UPI002B8FB2CB|nr:hypothetical protein [Flavobacterium sp.]HNP33788.1 hypothetical protein [Flavobacterium sp.]